MLTEKTVLIIPESRCVPLSYFAIAIYNITYIHYIHMHVVFVNWRKNCELFIQQTYKFNLENGNKVTDDVDVSVKGNFVQYHSIHNDTEVWVINDFNKVSDLLNNTTVKHATDVHTC